MINYLGVGGQARAGEDWPQSLSRKWGKDTKTITTICHAYTQVERGGGGETTWTRALYKISACICHWAVDGNISRTTHSASRHHPQSSQLNKGKWSAMGEEGRQGKESRGEASLDSQSGMGKWHKKPFCAVLCRAEEQGREGEKRGDNAARMTFILFASSGLQTSPNIRTRHTFCVFVFA